MATPLEALAHFYHQLDAALARFEADQPVFGCPAECCECCAQLSPFLMSLVEYEYLCAYARRHLAREERQRIRAQAQELALAYQFATVVQAEEKPALRERLPLQRCPLLNDQGRCLVYPARPLACRMYGRTLFTQGPEAGRFNGCTILSEQANLAAGGKVKMHSADSLRQQLLNLNVAVRNEGGTVAFNTLVKFLAELGFAGTEADLTRHFSGVAFRAGHKGWWDGF